MRDTFMAMQPSQLPVPLSVAACSGKPKLHNEQVRFSDTSLH